MPGSILLVPRRVQTVKKERGRHEKTIRQRGRVPQLTTSPAASILFVFLSCFFFALTFIISAPFYFVRVHCVLHGGFYRGGNLLADGHSV